MSKKTKTKKTGTGKTSKIPKKTPKKTPKPSVVAPSPTKEKKPPKSDLVAKQWDANPGPRIYDEEITRHKVVITREMAQKWLDTRHPGQRQIGSTHAKTFSLKIENGSWRPTPQGIILDWHGRLMDGQHRLAGFLATDPEKYPTILATVTTGSDPHDFTELDGDAADRKIKDLLAGAKVPNPAQAASAFKACVDYALTHQFFQDNPEGKGQASFGHRTATRSRASRKDVLEWVLEHQELVNHVTSRTKTMGPLRPQGLFSGLYLLTALEDRKKADAFFGPLISGENLAPGSPILVLRQQFEKLAGEKVMKTKDFVRAAMLIKAWNLWLQKVKKIEPSDLKHNEKMPWPLRIDAQPFEW